MEIFQVMDDLVSLCQLSTKPHQVKQGKRWFAEHFYASRSNEFFQVWCFNFIQKREKPHTSLPKLILFSLQSKFAAAFMSFWTGLMDVCLFMLLSWFAVHAAYLTTVHEHHFLKWGFGFLDFFLCLFGVFLLWKLSVWPWLESERLRSTEEVKLWHSSLTG